jgi:hypothetical protein
MRELTLAGRGSCDSGRAPRQRGATLLWGRRARDDGNGDDDNDGDDDLLRARAVIFVVVRGTTAEAEAATQPLIDLLLRQPGYTPSG